MSKWMVFFVAVLLAAVAGCTTSSATPTNCVASVIDAGSANDVVCNLGWTCNSGSEHYQLICTTMATPGNVSCTCSSDQNANDTTTTIMVNDTFVCNGRDALPVLDTCGNWQLQLQM